MNPAKYLLPLMSIELLLSKNGCLKVLTQVQRYIFFVSWYRETILKMYGVPTTSTVVFCLFRIHLCVSANLFQNFRFRILKITQMRIGCLEKRRVQIQKISIRGLKSKTIKLILKKKWSSLLNKV